MSVMPFPTSYCVAKLRAGIAFVFVTFVAQSGLIAQSDSTNSTASTLKAAVGDRYKIGVGVSDNIPSREKDWELLSSHFQIVTPENSMKPQSIQPREGSFASILAIGSSSSRSLRN